jgi:aspartate aminotransferase, mitochondrial
MFCFSGLTPEHVQKLKEVHHVYLTKDGRISMAGVTTANVEYISKAIVDVTRD